MTSVELDVQSMPTPPPTSPLTLYAPKTESVQFSRTKITTYAPGATARPELPSYAPVNVTLFVTK